jgi:hypothetical protein
VSASSDRAAFASGARKRHPEMPMKGRRVANGEAPTEPGDYSWMPRGTGPEDFKAEHADGYPRIGWWLMTPNGRSGSLDPKLHTVTVHEDGTISVHPSIRIPESGALPAFHGWLVEGEWRRA